MQSSISNFRHHILAPADRCAAQWEHLQYYEEQKWKQQVDSSYSSLASSAASSSSTSDHGHSGGGHGHGRMSARSKLLQMKREGWRKLKNRFSSLSAPKSPKGGGSAAHPEGGAPLPRGSSKCHSVSYHDFQTVSTAPGGGAGGGAAAQEVSTNPGAVSGPLGVIPKIR